jgi:hypothetical protein
MYLCFSFVRERRSTRVEVNRTARAATTQEVMDSNLCPEIDHVRLFVDFLSPSKNNDGYCPKLGGVISN